MHDLAGLGPGDRAFEPRGDRILAGAGFAQLALQLGDVRLVAAQHLLDLVHLGLEALGHLGRFLALGQRGLREVVAILAERELGLCRPVALDLVEPAQRAAHFLDVGDRPGGGRPNLDQRLFHLQDHHPDHLGRVFRPVEKLGDVGRENIARPAEDGAAQPAGDRSEPGRAAVGSLGLLDQHWRANRDLGFEDFKFRH